MEFNTQISWATLYDTILVLWKNIKYFKIFDRRGSAWKTNLNGTPTLVLQLKAQISGTRYQKPRNITKFLTIQKTPWKLVVLNQFRSSRHKSVGQNIFSCRKKSRDITKLLNIYQALGNLIVKAFQYQFWLLRHKPVPPKRSWQCFDNPRKNFQFITRFSHTRENWFRWISFSRFKVHCLIMRWFSWSPVFFVDDKFLMNWWF